MVVILLTGGGSIIPYGVQPAGNLEEVRPHFLTQATCGEQRTSPKRNLSIYDAVHLNILIK